MGFLVGMAAVLLLSRINTGIITLGQNLEIDTIAMVVIGGTALKGGKGNILGTLVGVFFLGSIGNAMNMLRLPSEVQFVAKGLVIIVAVSAGHVSSAITEFMSRRRELASPVETAEAKGGEKASWSSGTGGSFVSSPTHLEEWRNEEIGSVVAFPRRTRRECHGRAEEGHRLLHGCVGRLLQGRIQRLQDPGRPGRLGGP